MAANCRVLSVEGIVGGAGPGVGTHSWGLYGCMALAGVCAEWMCDEAMDTAEMGVFSWALKGPTPSELVVRGLRPWRRRA